MSNPVRTTIQKVIQNAELVRIIDEKIVILAENLVKEENDIQTYSLLDQLNTKDLNKQLIFLIITTRTGFCFWNAETIR